jgi:hypothetical protein
MEKLCGDARIRVNRIGFIRLMKTTIRTLQGEVFDCRASALAARNYVIDVECRRLAGLTEVAVAATAAIARMTADRREFGMSDLLTV